MLFSRCSALISAAVALLLLGQGGSAVDASVSISSQSNIGKKLLSKSSSVERELNNDDGYDTTWMENYSLKFIGCSTIPSFERAEEYGGGARSSLLVKYKLCPSNKCGSCRHGGEYVVEMREFLESYQEIQQEANEAACESTQESCEYACNDENMYYENYDGDDGDACEYQCMSDAGMSYCDNDNNGDNDNNDVAELAECRPINEDNNDNNNNNYNSNSDMYFVGAYCTGSGVYLSVFSDSACQKKASNDIYYKQTGYQLPTNSLVQTKDCISCGVDNGNNNNGNNNNNGDVVLESCDDLYDKSAKCESKMKDSNKYYKDEGSCDFIHSTLPSISKVYNRKVNWARAFAILFGIGFFVTALYICLLKRKGHLDQVDNTKLVDDLYRPPPNSNNPVV